MNVIALSIGVFLMAFGLAWGQGYLSYIYTAMRNFEAGDAQVLNYQYLSEERRFPLDLSIDDRETADAIIRSTGIVSETSPRIDFTLKLSNRKESTMMLGRGVSPAEGKVTVIENQIVKGSFFADEDRGILLGEDLAERMGLDIGDTLYITAVNRWGHENFISLRLLGIFKFGFPPIDKKVVFLDIKSAAELLDIQGKASKIVVRFKDGVSLDEGLRILNESLKTTNMKAYTWKRFAEGTVSAVQADMGSFFVFIVILYILIIIGIYNSMSMSVRERVGEIGTMRAIGAKRTDIITLLLLESFAISLLSIIIGYILAVPVMLYLSNVGIDIASSMPDDIPVPFGERFYAVFKPVQFFIASLIGIGSGVGGTFIPAVRASRLSVADSLTAKKHG